MRFPPGSGSRRFQGAAPPVDPNAPPTDAAAPPVDPNAPPTDAAAPAPAPAPMADPAAAAPAPAQAPVAEPGVGTPLAADPFAAPAEPEARATLENLSEAQAIARQQLVSDVRQRILAARALVNSAQPEAALNALKLAQNVVRSAADVDEAARIALDRELQADILSTVRAEERIVQDRAESLRLQAAAEQQVPRA